ncbi:DinB/UmuC family translesion DNA polymerase [Agathobaculum sp. LCP25S3_E8]|uniref:DinB/UmuC family translesion DNA polymerase n=1 Tax=Agathobaculum sp. LCP25S3_E8 TaxID=3438735 RepID=UPI003F92E97A
MFERQCKLKQPTDITGEIIHTALSLLRRQYGWQRTVRNPLHLAGRCAARQGNSRDRCQSRPHHPPGWLF